MNNSMLEAYLQDQQQKLSDYPQYEDLVKQLNEIAEEMLQYAKTKEVRLLRPIDVANFMIPYFAGRKQEEVIIITLTTRSNVIDRHSVFKGTLTSAIVHPRDIFRIAILDNAAKIIMVHNHPGEDIVPSEEDRKTAKRIYDAGELMGIELIDFIIIGGTLYSSIKEQGGIF